MIPAWTPNKVFMPSNEGNSWNAGQQGQASLGKSRQVGSNGKSWETGYWQLGYARLSKSRQVGGDGKS